jgi:hypothetical protein
MFERLPESIKHGGEIIESKKRRHDSSPQFHSTRPNQLRQEDFTAPKRASTLPENMLDPKRTTLSHSLPISQSHLASLGLHDGYNSPSPSNQDFFDPVPGLTPTSSTASLAGFGIPAVHTPQQRPSFPATPLGAAFADPSGLNVPDISTIMFPSGDPLAYPNQPMTTFESRHPHMFDRNTASPAMAGMSQHLSGVDAKSQSAAYPPPSSGRHDSEAHLFGPMYMMQGAQGGYQPHGGSPNVHMPGNGLQFDELMTQEEWANTFLDPSLSLINHRPTFNGNSHFGSGPGMGGW